MNIHYLAGLFDGEGSVSIYKIKKNRNPQYVLKIKIYSTKKKILNEIKEEFGGSIIKKDKQKNNHKSCYYWTTTTKKAKRVLNSMLPDLRIKQEHAKLAIEFQNREKYRGGRRGQSNRELEFKERCYLKMKNLNIRGI